MDLRANASGDFTFSMRRLRPSRLDLAQPRRPAARRRGIAASVLSTAPA
jgi:hypothetical protein